MKTTPARRTVAKPVAITQMGTPPSLPVGWSTCVVKMFCCSANTEFRVSVHAARVFEPEEAKPSREPNSIRPLAAGPT
jgi:hypothetical protein